MRTGKKYPNRKIAYRYTLCGKDAQILVKELFPKLIVKKKIAEVFLQFPTGIGRRDKDVEVKKKLHLMASILNKRGD